MPKAASTEAPVEEAPKESLASGKVVKYIGTADVREIDKKGWDDANVTDQGKVVWSKENNFTVPVADLSDSAVAYCDERDSGFVVTDADA